MWIHQRTDLTSHSTQRDCSWNVNGRSGFSRTISSCWRNSAKLCTGSDESRKTLNGSNGRNLDASEFVKEISTGCLFVLLVIYIAYKLVYFICNMKSSDSNNQSLTNLFYLNTILYLCCGSSNKCFQ